MAVCLSPGGSAVADERQLPRQLFVGTVDGIVSLERDATDAGWQVTGRGLPGCHVSAVLHEPRQGGWFAATYANGLYRGTDGGRTWEPLARGLSCADFWSLAAVERDGGVVLYAGAQPAHLFQSTDYGDSWEELPSLRAVPGTERWSFPPPPHLAHVKHITADPRDNHTLFVSVEQGALLKSTDAGRTWREIEGYTSPQDAYYKDVHRLAISAQDPRRMYMSNGDGLYSTADGGETWVQLPTAGIGYPDGLLIAPHDDRELYISGGQGGPPDWRRTHTANSIVARSRDAGQTWTVLDRGLPVPLRANVEALSMAIWDGGFSLFAGTTDGDVFASDDGGEHWSTIAQGLPPVSGGRHYRDLELPAAAI